MIWSILKYDCFSLSLRLIICKYLNGSNEARKVTGEVTNTREQNKTLFNFAFAFLRTKFNHYESLFVIFPLK
jgi:hypothetical protein